MKTNYILSGLLIGIIASFVTAGEPDFLVNWEGKIETYKIQAAASTTLQDAFKVFADVDAMGYSQLGIDSTSNPGVYFKVQLGLYSDRTEARPVLKEVKGKGYPDAFIVSQEITEAEGKEKGANLCGINF